MYIELQHLGFKNKGAALMALAIIDAVSEKFPKARFVMIPSNEDDFKKFQTLNIYPKFSYKKLRISWDFLADLAPIDLRKRYGIVAEKDIDVVINGAGFRFGEQWGYKTTQEMERMCFKWKKRGVKIILMPQAFGPFESKENKNAIRNIINCSDVVYARDDESYRHLVEQADNKEKIHLAPDFTCLLDGKTTESYEVYKDGIAIIPNSKMTEKTSHKVKENYKNFLERVIKHLQDDNKVFFLNHEGEGDIKIANDINGSLQKKLDIVNEDDPLVVKGIIGKCKAVVSSRFHGLVNALSQGVPALATSWSHKYENLLNDYNYPEGLVSVDSPFETLTEKLDMISKQSSNKEVSERLLFSSNIQKQKVKDMWEEVFKFINNKKR